MCKVLLRTHQFKLVDTGASSLSALTRLVRFHVLDHANFPTTNTIHSYSDPSKMGGCIRNTLIYALVRSQCFNVMHSSCRRAAEGCRYEKVDHSMPVITSSADHATLTLIFRSSQDSVCLVHKGLVILKVFRQGTLFCHSRARVNS